MGIAVSDDFARGTKVWKDMLDIKVGDVGGGSRLMAGNEDGGL